MSLAQINKLIEKYFEGETSLAEEQTLKSYFTSTEVDASLAQYKSLFIGFSELSKTEAPATLSKKIENITTETKKTPHIKLYRWLSVAATVLIAFGIIFTIRPWEQKQQMSQEMLYSYNQSVEILGIVSSSLNKTMTPVKEATEKSDPRKQLNTISKLELPITKINQNIKRPFAELEKIKNKVTKPKN